MIIGFGSDLIDMQRVEKLLNRHGSRFIERCFTPEEQEKAESRRAFGRHIDTYAKRFAAKEACAKALGTGIAHGVYLKDIGVVNDEHGRPALRLNGGALERLHAMTPKGMRSVIHLTLTDEPPMALAQVIIEAV